jgi:hypothetical protein
MPVRIEIRLARNANRIQIAAMNQIFSDMLFLPGRVMDDSCFFESHKAASHHRVENRQETVDFLLGIHDFHYQRQIHGKLEDL